MTTTNDKPGSTLENSHPLCTGEQRIPTSAAVGVENLLSSLDPTILLTPSQVAEILHKTTNTLRFWRCCKKGPRYIKLDGSTIRYSVRDVQAFINAGIVEPDQANKVLASVVIGTAIALADYAQEILAGINTLG